MRVVFVLAFSAFVLSASVSARDQFAIPASSPLVLASAANQPGATTRFRGKVEVAGKFEFAWHILDGEPDALEAFFFPSDASRELLPYEVGAQAPHVVEVLNTQAAAYMLLGAKESSALLAKRKLRVSGIATVVLHQYFSAVECDHRYYGANVLSVVAPSSLLASLGFSYARAC